ncbi:hypothetical protein SIO70_32460 [Chitinophaga sancti]|uniref:hypothetical protein n=1 Tax=Chitinophaga sancti TaxID=1004 RepID=UPI002A755681|nr:hypothetical protein [Chitinophaga sancti]WPQ63082.1 hypothetical protein SIO70_32460 [Chitinophaga sancti]
MVIDLAQKEIKIISIPNEQLANEPGTVHVVVSQLLSNWNKTELSDLAGTKNHPYVTKVAVQVL